MKYTASQHCIEPGCRCRHAWPGVITAERVSLREAWDALDRYSYDEGEIEHPESGRVYLFRRDQTSGRMRMWRRKP